MKKNILFVLATSAAMAFYGCGSKNTETAETSEAAVEEASEEEKRPSPLEVKEGSIGAKSIKVQYGSPAVKGRTLWGDLVPYNVVWRTGANEATFIDVPQDITVEGKPLAAGKYSLFTIPKETGKWTVILNSDWNLEHGHFQYDEKNDVLRVEVTPVWEETTTERLSIDIESPGLVIRWDKLKLPITIQ
ncbi:DUF2911 domain-containing protein [Algoriphagus mannitolivorans]|uniref:DUF2911 domain-containing protein n=1 Tax=Algoriphagus mannitolivorans TaxID=226504 RepID=UPI000414E595|nr:DUF2911 domain-containing protein [Algoriphagus mannitolivorans]